MLETLHREFVYLWYYFSAQSDQLFRYWLIGMLVGSAFSVFLKNTIHEAFRFLNSRANGFAGIVVASFLALPPLYACMERFLWLLPFPEAGYVMTGWLRT